MAETNAAQGGYGRCWQCGAPLRSRPSLYAEMREAGAEIRGLSEGDTISRPSKLLIQEHAETIRVAVAQLDGNCGEHR